MIPKNNDKWKAFFNKLIIAVNLNYFNSWIVTKNYTLHNKDIYYNSINILQNMDKKKEITDKYRIMKIGNNMVRYTFLI